MSAQRKHAGRLIKRYGNRKLYDVAASRYITLDGIRDLVREGEDVRVVDNDSDEELTAVTFAQIIYEDAKKQNGDRSLPLFRWLIQRGDEAMRDLFRSVERGREAFDSVREATEKRMQQLVGGGKSRPKRGSFIDELLQAPQRQLDQLQQRIDAQVRQSVERVTSHPAFQKEIRRVESSIKRLEHRLTQLRSPARPAIAARKPARRRKSSRKTTS
jgi:polyhydroxyalkanoate synthesis repressor PhaR